MKNCRTIVRRCPGASGCAGLEEGPSGWVSGNSPSSRYAIARHGEAGFGVSSPTSPGGLLSCSLKPHHVGDWRKMASSQFLLPRPNHPVQAALTAQHRHDLVSLSRSTVSCTSQALSWDSNPNILKDPTPHTRFWGGTTLPS